MTGDLAIVRRVVDLTLIVAIFGLLGLAAIAHIAPALGRQVIVIRGSSMEPSIPLGSAVLARRIDPAAIKTGDVVTIRHSNGVLVTHRVTRVAGEANARLFETKGDASESPDPVLVPATALVGIPDVVIPFAGYLLAAAETPIGMMGLAAILAMLLLAAWLIEDFESDRRQQGRPDHQDAVAIGRTATG